MLQHPYEDPEGRVDLPASIKCNVDHWKRPVEFIQDKVHVPQAYFHLIYTSQTHYINQTNEFYC